jgi:phosphoribosylaminoimidazolecarboxamide formyltransferase/IMP cyclohydrolase
VGFPRATRGFGYFHVMTDLVRVRRALLSVSDKNDLIPFARALAAHGIELISTGGTARMLFDAGLRVLPVEHVTGFPEMMDGRIKTLHPLIHGGLLARRDVNAHVQSMRDHNIKPIDLVCINLYPFERTLREELSRDEAIELIDIGGPAMIRSAAKNHEFVAVVTAPSQYDRIVSELNAHEGATTLELRRDLAAAAFSRTAEYDAAISSWMCGRAAASFPPTLRLSMTRQDQLRYGENPHQKAAVYADPAEVGPSVVKARLLSGKPLSYNNLNDAAAALELVREVERMFPARAAAAIIKHTNPCGAALGATAKQAFERAYEGDPVAAFGGILAISAGMDAACAESVCPGEKFFEVIVAPSFDEGAVALLAERWKNVRLLEVGALEEGPNFARVEYRSLPGGMLVQERDRTIPDATKWQHVAGPAPANDVVESAAFLFLCAKHLKSNAVAIGAAGQLLGAGAGQMDRVTAARLAVEKAGAKIKASKATVIAASDGFFPFPDGPQLLIDAGVRVIVQPGGSKKDQETIDLCVKRSVTLLMTGVRHFKH